MRKGAFVFVALLLCSCSSHTTSLDSARDQFLEARADYQACMNATTGDVTNNCESKRMVMDASEQAYRDAMGGGVSGSPR